MLPVIALAVVAIGVTAWGAIRRTYRRQIAAWHADHPTGDDGVIPGAEAIALVGGPRAALLLHGFGDTPQTLRAIAETLHAKGWTVHAPLLPGHGRSLEDFRRSRAADWVECVRDAHDALMATHPRLAIAGLSMGASLAVALAARRQPSAIVLLAPFLSAPRRARLWSAFWPLWQLWQPWVPSQTKASIRDPAARAQSLGYGCSTPRLLRQLRGIIDQAFAALPAVQAPALVIASTHDYRVATDSVRNAFARLRDKESRLEWVDRSGHVITVDYDRDVVIAHTVAWLERWG